MHLILRRWAHYQSRIMNKNQKMLKEVPSDFMNGQLKTNWEGILFFNLLASRWLLLINFTTKRLCSNVEIFYNLLQLTSFVKLLSLKTQLMMQSFKDHFIPNTLLLWFNMLLKLTLKNLTNKSDFINKNMSHKIKHPNSTSITD